jgi:hypothetical protein
VKDSNLKPEDVRPFIPNALYLLVLIHLAIAIPLAYYLNIWSDEASTLYSTQNGPLSAVLSSVTEKQAPFYFVLMGAWRMLGESIFFARVFSLVCTTLSIGTFFLIARRFWGSQTAIYSTFFFALHPYIFWAANEIRLYSLVILISLVLVFLFEKIFLRDEEPGLTLQATFLLFATVGIYTNYYLGFQLASMFFVLIVLRRFEAAKRYFVYMMITGFVFSPMAYGFYVGLDDTLDGVELARSVTGGIRQIWNHLLTFVLPTELFPPEDQTNMSFVRAWIVRAAAVVAIVGLLKSKDRLDRRMVVFGVLSAGIAGFLLFAYFAVGPLYIEIRHAAVFFVPASLFLVALIYSLTAKAKYGKQIIGIISVLLIVSYSYGLTAIYPGFVKRGDWKRVANYVQMHESDNQPVIVFRTYEAIAFGQNYDGENRVLPDTKFFYWNYEGEIGTESMWPKQINWVISQIPADAKEVWLVTEEICHTSEACEPLDNFVKANYTVIKQKDFYKERVRLLRKR